MEDVSGLLWRPSREIVYVRESQRKAQRKSKCKEKETPGAVGEPLAQRCAIAKGQQPFAALYTHVTALRRASLALARRPLSRKCSVTFLIFAGSVFFTSSLLFLGAYVQGVRSHNIAAPSLSRTEECLRGRRVPHTTGDSNTSRLMSRSSSPRHFEERNFMLTTSRHDAAVQVPSGKPRNAVVDTVSRQAVIGTNSSSASARNSASAKHHAARRESGTSSLQPPDTGAAAENRQKPSAFSQRRTSATPVFDLPATTKNALVETNAHSYLKRIRQTKETVQGPLKASGLMAEQRRSASPAVSSVSVAEVSQERLQKPLKASGLVTEQQRSASPAIYSASLADVSHAFRAKAPQKYNSASLSPAEHGLKGGALRAREPPVQRRTQLDKELKSVSHADIAYEQLLRPAATVPVATNASMVQSSARQSRNLFPASIPAGVDGSVDVSSNLDGKLFHGGYPLAVEAAALAASASAAELSPVSLSSGAHLPIPSSVDQLQALPMQQAGQPAYGAAVPVQSLVAELPVESALSLPVQQLVTAAPEQRQTALTVSPYTTGTPYPQHQTGPLPSAFSNTVVQNGTTPDTSGATGVPSLRVFQISPPGEQPATVTAGPAPTAQSPGAGASTPTVTVPIQVFSTRESPTTAAPSAAAAFTTSPVPLQTAPVPSATAPAFPLPAPVTVGVPEPLVVMPPLPVSTPAIAEAAQAVPEGAAVQAAPAQVAAGLPAAEAAPGAQQITVTPVVPQGGYEGRGRTPTPRGARGALLPPAGPNGEQEPIAPKEIVVGEAATSSRGRFTPLSTEQATCLETCNCVGLIVGGFASLFLCLTSVIIATLLMSRLFSKVGLTFVHVCYRPALEIMLVCTLGQGLFSMAFFRGGANAILAAAVLGFTVGGLTGGLVHRCWPGALYFGGGLMSFSAALVLLGKRGAGVGALGGVITGGCVGGLASTEALPISLGCVVGLLLGIVLGFAPIFRDLKMNTRYIRYGFESRQPSLQHQSTTARGGRADGLPTKRLPQRLFSSPTRTSSLRTSVSLPTAEDSMGRRAESLPSSS